MVVHRLECATLCRLVLSIQYLATRMAHGTIREFDPQKESIEDFHVRFEFYCVANNLRPGEGDNRKKALFITLLGQGSFSKLKALVHPTAVSDHSLDAILQHLAGHYRPKTIEIAEKVQVFQEKSTGKGVSHGIHS